VGVNLGTVQQLYFQGEFRRLRDVTIDLDPLPGDMGLVDPVDAANRLGSFTGRGWLIERIDEFIADCLARRVGGYLLVEAEAGMGKSALATYLAFTRAWPTHVTRLPGGTSPEGARTNLVAQLIARWELSDAAPGGVLPAGHDTTPWLYGRLCEAARRRDNTEPTSPVMLLVDGLDEAPPAVPGQLPLGLPLQLPAGAVVLATTRPGTRLPVGMRVERIDVESQLNRDDLLVYLRRITASDPQLVQPLTETGMNRERFCRALLDGSGGVWIYALSVLDQIRDQRRSPAEVTHLPPGLASYYANNIVRWCNDPAWDWDQVTLPLLATLAAARKPQPAAVLADWAEVGQAQAKDLLRGAFRAFLVVRAGGDPDIYALRHQSLRDLLEGRLPSGTDDDRLRELAYDLKEATRAAHARIVAAVVPAGDNASRDWSKVDDYARAHLAEHAALGDQLNELVCDPEFLLATSVPELLRVRRHVTSAAGTAAVGALELASGSWSEKHNDRLRWLEVSARKIGCGLLAESVTTRLDTPWRCRTALWSGSSHRTLTGHTDSVEAVAAVPMPDGSTLVASAGNDATVRLWDPVAGSVRGELIGHTGWVGAVAAVPMPDGSTLVASAGNDATVRLWDPVAGSVRGELIGHTDRVRALAAVPMPDGSTLVASAGDDATVRLWDPVAGSVRGELIGHTGWVGALAAVPMPDGSTLLTSAGADGTVRLWNPVTGSTQYELTGHTGSVQAVAAVPLADESSLLASAGADGTVRLWNPVTGSTQYELTGHTGSVRALAAVPMPDGSTQLASAGSDWMVRLWDPVTGSTRGELTGHTGWVRAAVAVRMPDRSTLIASAGNDRIVRLWNPLTGSTYGEFTGHTDSVLAMAAVPMPDGSTLIASAGDDVNVRLWDPVTGSLRRFLASHTDSVWALAAVPMPDGSTLIASAGEDVTVRLWDPITGNVHGELTGHTSSVLAIVAVPMPDGSTQLASAGHDQMLRLWDPVTGSARRTLTGHTDSVRALAAVPMPDGGTLIASAGGDAMVRLWDPVTGSAFGTLTGHTGWVGVVAAVPMPDGITLLASAGHDRAVMIWEPRSQKECTAGDGHRTTAR
jgi:WD40 repeat protein